MTPFGMMLSRSAASSSCSICVFGSFIVTGGSVAAIWRSLPFEMLTIGGAAIGTFVMANSMHEVSHTLGGLGRIMKGARFHKADYVELLSLLFLLVRLAATKGAMALEPISRSRTKARPSGNSPRSSPTNSPAAMICDYLRMVGMNADDPHQIEDVMARELKKTLPEEMHGAHALQVVADALPALGIVAAVLGVIKTMAHIDQPPKVLGRDDRRAP